MHNRWTLHLQAPNQIGGGLVTRKIITTLNHVIRYLDEWESGATAWYTQPLDNATRERKFGIAAAPFIQALETRLVYFKL